MTDSDRFWSWGHLEDPLQLKRGLEAFGLIAAIEHLVQSGKQNRRDICRVGICNMRFDRIGLARIGGFLCGLKFSLRGRSSLVCHWSVLSILQ